MRIFIDADACPVKDEVVRVAARHRVAVLIVSNGGIRPRPDPLVETVIVGNAPDAADDWIVARIGPGDVAVTADILLADRCLKAGAEALGPTGEPFTEEGIGMAVGMRDLMAHLRETGAVGGHNAAFSRRDRSRFLEALEATLNRLKRHRHAAAQKDLP
ncbi:MAG: YaiI/YqxD family protein [Acetobacterales bacterium]